MGSWTDLDANYPPGALTPATALVVALAHVAGAAHDADAALALLPELGFIPGLHERTARYLHEMPLDTFLAEAHTLLSARQKLVIALRLHDAHRAADAPAERSLLLERIITGLGIPPIPVEPTAGVMQPQRIDLRQALLSPQSSALNAGNTPAELAAVHGAPARTNDLELFPQ
jgi:hypothetical protein